MKATNRRVNVRNQRVSNSRQRRQQNILEVKVRSRTATQHRNRRIMVGLSKIVLLLALGGGLYLGGSHAARTLFFENPDYRLETITVFTDGTLAREQILRAAALEEGVNIFRVNLSAVHDRLQELPQVDEVEVVRRMPREIDIRIIERKPVAWITSEQEFSDPFTSGRAFLVDARGVLMRQKKLLPEYLGLPVILGCKSQALEAGRVVDSFDARAALELLRLGTGSFMQTRFQIRQIDLSRGYCLVVTDRNGSRITFGFDQLERQIERLERFLVHADDNRQEIATVNLMVQRNIPVTFAPTAVEVINATVDPVGQSTVGPRVMKAIPVAGQTPPPSQQKFRPLRTGFAGPPGHSSQTAATKG